ncbi:chlorohydrolase family protein [Devosia psychrophila]|uniref:Cytosine/adenosine deaminase n=1 Tax=Devosia psychrophila TaxID=728005 RepID=A0A0F5PWL8_9HYPH|nr:chlorohydrolase family protein [Devosia psychrophila]KKC32801.1 hypothetical protein WH91_11980 [Devosia psychrophila]SFD21313.1 Cytosine/adenosine deaminase [Devosia psychrophila]
MLTKLTSKWVLAFEGADHVLIEDGEVLFANGKVLSIGPATRTEADRHEDFGGALIAPGFIDLNALADADTTILGFGSAGDATRGTWSADYAATAHDVLDRTEMLAAAHAAFGQLLLSGTTTALPVTSLLFRAWAENSDEFDAFAGLSQKLGIRLVLGPSFRSAVNVIDADGALTQIEDEARGLAGLDDAISFIRRHQSSADSLISGLLVPSTIDTCSDALLVRTAQAAQELGVPFRLHCCQSETEADLIWARSGKTSIGLLRDLGILSERALLPHAINLGGPDADPALIAADLSVLAESGATVVHCPLVVGRGGRRLDSFGAFLRQGIAIGIGTDTTPPNMLMNLQMGLATARFDGRHATGPAEYYRAATLGGAKALNRPDLGRLAVGSAADIVVWDLSVFDAQPSHDPIEALFLMPPGLRADQVWVAGRRVVKDGHVVDFNESEASASLQTIFEKLRNSYAERHWKGHDWQSLFPPAFPVRRQAQPSTGKRHHD